MGMACEKEKMRRGRRKEAREGGEGDNCTLAPSDFEKILRGPVFRTAGTNKVTPRCRKEEGGRGGTEAEGGEWGLHRMVYNVESKRSIGGARAPARPEREPLHARVEALIIDYAPEK